jgi:hypothetical protein
MSLCLDCILFTLKGKNVKENKYIPIFTMWLSLLKKNGGLDASDLLHIKMDTDTFEYIKTDIAFCHLYSKNITCQIKILLVPPPSDIREGMLMRYKKIEYTQDIYMYCDIDILVLKPLKQLFNSLPINTVCAHVEGLLTDTNYGEAFSKEEHSNLPENSPGFSSGKFIIYGKELYSNFIDIMEAVAAVAGEKTNKYFTVDQPLYNKALYILHNPKYQIKTLDKTLISLNGHAYTKSCVLLDTMGMPGNGELHFDKIIKYYILIQDDLL